MDKGIQKNKIVTLNIPAMNGGALGTDNTGAPLRVSSLDRWMARKLLDLLDEPALVLVLWNGEEITACPGKPVARVLIHDNEALNQLLINPALNFGDLYSVGRIEIDGDLVEFLETAYRAAATSPKYQKLKAAQTRLFNRPRTNRLAESRDNIQHHYDIGNEFYELWLDNEAMQYTCAYFPSVDLTLEQAQRAKMDHVCRKLRLKPGDRVVEAGGGWGGFARYMAKHYGVSVTSYNISHQQIAYAREKSQAAQLDGMVEYVEDDYRRITGEYDVFVSVGMLEHVGRDHYGELGDVIDRCLSPGGRGLIHSIGRNKPELMNAWTEKRIFPGAYPPTLREMMEIFEEHEFSVLDVENLRLHYAKTLSLWLERLNVHGEKIEKLYDMAFLRAWRLYLAGSIAAFTTGSLQLFQVVFTRGSNNDLPWSRAYMYERDRQD